MINKRHPDILRPYSELKVYVNIKSSGRGEEIYFSLAASLRFNMNEGDRLEFDDGGSNEWTFVVNNHPDGFPLIGGSDRGTCGVKISSKGLVTMIKKNNNIVLKQRYPLRDTGRELDGLPVIQILFNKPMPNNFTK